MTTSERTVSRVEALLARMTLAEKLGQMNMPLPFPTEAVAFLELEHPPPAGAEQFEAFSAGTYEPGLGPGGGFFGLCGFFLLDGPRDQAETFNRLQQVAEATRLGIPLLQIAEGTHGVLAAGATVFPEGLSLGSTWDLDLIERLYAAVAREARSVGIHMLCTLVAEPIRDPRLGRNCEGYTECPYLLSRLIAAVVSGCQGGDVTAPDRAGAMLTAFLAQSEGTSGLERGSLEVSERTIREVFLPPWEAGLTESGALGVMADYVTVDGVPTHSSERLLTNLLREELGFAGVTVSEGLGFETLVYEGVARDQREAGKQGLRAGVDVNITYEPAYLPPLLGEEVEAGLVPTELIDLAVRRVLTVKERLGLFDGVLVDPDRAVEVVHSKKHVELAREAARAGIVLLRNEGGLLPLDATLGTIALVGPNADAPLNQLGDYTIAMLGGGGTTDRLPPIVTVLEGIRAAAPYATVLHAQGCDILGDDTSRIAEAVEIARQADIAIVVVGEQFGSPLNPASASTNGEQADVASLDLTGVQDDLVRAVHATGTPTVAVLINGRPLSTRWIAEHVPAIVEAWLPGEQGGSAVADVLFGIMNPTGRLPITVPRHAGQLPVYYNHRRSKGHFLAAGKSYVDMPATPLWEFGFGLSYTTFEYANLALEPTEIGASDTIVISVDVTNSGARSGTETVQLYVRDLVASVAPRWKELRGFERVLLDPGETATVRFELGPDALRMLDRDLKWIVEAGEFEVEVGASSQDIRVAGRFVVAP